MSQASELQLRPKPALKTDHFPSVPGALAPASLPSFLPARLIAMHTECVPGQVNSQPLKYSFWALLRFRLIGPPRFLPAPVMPLETGESISFVRRMPDVPFLAEPFFLKFQASCKFRILMSPEDLQKAGLEELGKKWG